MLLVADHLQMEQAFSGMLAASGLSWRLLNILRHETVRAARNGRVLLSEHLFAWETPRFNRRWITTSRQDKATPDAESAGSMHTGEQVREAGLLLSPYDPTRNAAQAASAASRPEAVAIHCQPPPLRVGGGRWKAVSTDR